MDGEDNEHIRMLADSGAKLPPVIVHRVTMRVIDGMHRLGAALLRGDEMIEVRFFDGSEQEAFVLAVQANIAHGRPLSLADRTNAADRIIRSHPTWSDRAIALIAGLGARAVAGIRRRIESGVDATRESAARLGRDGRLRPINSAEGRMRAADLIKSRPNASLREIATSAGVSPTTALDVRNRIQSGGDPIPAMRIRQPAGRVEAAPPEPTTTEHNTQPGLAAMLMGLQRDPSLRFTESGRALLRWILSRAIQPGEWHDVADGVPTHCTYILAEVARRFADEWQRVADELDTRRRTLDDSTSLPAG